jgi:hypothetical protein
LTLTSGSISSIANAADRCIEGRSDARPGTGGDQCDALTGRHLDELPESRAERRADLNDRPFAADRGATADRQCRGQRFGDRYDRPDAPAIIVDRVHDLRDAVALRLWREFRDDEGDADGPDDRHQDHPRPPRVERREQAAVVGE